MSTPETEMNPDFIYVGKNGGMTYILKSRRLAEKAIRFSVFQNDKKGKVVYMCFHCQRVKDSKAPHQHHFFTARAMVATPRVWASNPDANVPHACGFPTLEHDIEQVITTVSSNMIKENSEKVLPTFHVRNVIDNIDDRPEFDGLSPSKVTVVKVHMRTKTNSFRRLVRKNNEKKRDTPATPTSIPEKYKKLRGDKKILQHSDKNGFLFFNPELWETALTIGIDAIIGDGSFKAGVSEYGDNAQLYTLHMVHHDSSFPMLIAMLSAKTKTSYRKMFTSLFDQLTPNGINILKNTPWIFDYEPATVTALKESLIGVVTVRGCSFHFAQSLNRKITSVFAQGRSNNPHVQQWIDHCRASVFLPKDLVRYYGIFQVPLYFSSFPPDVIKACNIFSSYLLSTYLCGPVFSEMWSHYGNLRHRTSNFAEGYHRGLRTVFARQTPNLDEVLEVSYQFLSQSKTDIDVLSDGKEIPNNMTRLRKDKLNIIALKMFSFKQKVDNCPFVLPYNHVIDHLNEMLEHIPSNTK